jgi:hypothetical protein
MVPIRKLVGFGATVLGLGVIFALAVNAQVGAAPSPATPHNTGASQLKAFESIPRAELAVVPREEPAAPAPTAACTSARNVLATAKTKDAAEDATERAAAKTAPKTAAAVTAAQNEDKAEKAAIKPLRDAVVKECGSLKAPLTPECAAALQALKTANANEQPEDQAEKAKPLSADADKTEDAAERAKLLPLMNTLRSACGTAIHHKL